MAEETTIHSSGQRLKEQAAAGTSFEWGASQHSSAGEIAAAGYGEGLANALGIFSLALGAAEAAMPSALARAIGLADNPDSRLVLQAYGLREIATGVGILAFKRPTGWLWARVAGDLLDLATLGLASVSPGTDRRKIAAATASVLGVTALDLLCAGQLSRQKPAWALLPAGGPVHVVKTITVNRSPEDVYAFWRNLENLPRFMKHLESVRTDGRNSHWVARAPGGTLIEWDAETTEDRPRDKIAWRSLAGSSVEHSGEVSFRPGPGGRGTVVRVELSYAPPAGMLGSMAARLLGEEPGSQVQEDLRRFKQVMEVGEVITTEGQPSGRASSTSAKYDQEIRSYQ